MKKDTDNIIVIKSKAFALDIIQTCKYLSETKKEYVLSKQILRSGTSIGANVKEAVRAQSKADFRAKMNIALKESSETEYWLDLLSESKYLLEEESRTLTNKCQELLRILTSIVKNSETK